MARVFRIEAIVSVLTPAGKRHHSSTNIGPFVRREYLRELGCFESAYLRTPCNLQPEPEEDGMTIRYGWHSGCADMAQLIRFFRDDMPILEWGGYAVSEYEVPEQYINYGRSQVQFLMNHAVLISMKPPRIAEDDFYESMHSEVA